MSKIVFTAFKLPESIPCYAGDKVEDIHSLAYDEDGHPYLKVTGKRDVVSEINSYRAECDINRIILRYANGDASALGDPNGGFYGDVSSLPKSLIDVYKSVDNARHIFERLDGDVKQQYQSFDDFLSVFGDSNGIADFLGQLSKKEEVKEGDVSNE